mgnify:FL=1
MFGKNLKYYRLKKSMTKKMLADKINLTPMAITNYEDGNRMPNMDIIKKLAKVLDVNVSDFLAIRNERLVFNHGEFRKNSTLTNTQQEFVRESVEEYFSRFYSVVELLGGDVLPIAPNCHVIQISNDSEVNAKKMRIHLGLNEDGPIDDLIAILENKGIFVYVCDIKNSKFFGMNGFVNNRPYIIVNKNMSPERTRSTIAHELAHLLFKWPENMDKKDEEKIATSIAGAFLFPKIDAIRELGLCRSKVTNDMAMVCHEYGISMFLLAKRAKISKIISTDAERNFYITASSLGWKTDEPIRITSEEPTLFEQLVFRAVCEGDISIQRGAELLKVPYEFVLLNCKFGEVD